MAVMQNISALILQPHLVKKNKKKNKPFMLLAHEFKKIKKINVQMRR